MASCFSADGQHERVVGFVNARTWQSTAVNRPELPLGRTGFSVSNVGKTDDDGVEQPDRSFLRQRTCACPLSGRGAGAMSVPVFEAPPTICAVMPVGKSSGITAVCPGDASRFEFPAPRLIDQALSATFLDHDMQFVEGIEWRPSRADTFLGAQAHII